MCEFSILIPAYKKKFFRRCLSSILNQTYKDFEIVVVNDASPEDLAADVMFFDDERIRYFENTTNIGAINVVDNWNKCLSFANGRYVICMGDDDELTPQCLEEYQKMIIKYPEINVIHGRTQLIDENGSTVAILEARDEIESVWMNIYYRWKKRSQFIGDYCFKGDVLRSKGGFYKLPLAWSSDDITVNIMSEVGGIANVNTVVFRYRISPLTISSSNNAAIKIEAMQLEAQWYKDLLTKYMTDDVYYQLVKTMCDTVMLKKKIECISSDISKNLLNGFVWFRKAPKIGLNRKMIVFASISAFLECEKNRFKHSSSGARFLKK